VLIGSHPQLPDLDGHCNPRVGGATPFRPTIPLRSIVGLNGRLGLRGSYRQRFTLPGKRGGRHVIKNAGVSFIDLQRSAGNSHYNGFGDLKTNGSGIPGIGAIPAVEKSLAQVPVGNWERYTTREDGAEVLDQSRVHNRDNQLVQIDGTNSGLLYDRGGQALKTRPGANGSWTDYFQMSWDGWGRLGTVDDGLSGIRRCD